MAKPSLKKNALMSAILTMSSFIFPLITFPYISRILLPVGTGKVNFATSVITYFAMFAQLGIPTYGVRMCAKVRDDKEKLSRAVHELMGINLFMCVLVYAVFAVSLICVSKFREEKTLLIITSMTILLHAVGAEWLYRALEQYSYITVRSLIFKIISLLAMFALVHEQKDYVVYGSISVFASSASSILNLINLRKYIYFKPVGNYNFKQHIKPILVFFSLSVTTTIYTNLDNVMLGFIKDDEQVGYYGAAVKIKTILLSLITSVSSVLLPRASYYVDKGFLDEFYRILKKTMRFILLVSVPMSVYFLIFAQEGIFFLSGNNYGKSILPMQIIMPTLVLIGITNTIGIQMLVPLGKEKLVVYSTLCGAITDLVLNAVLIPKYASVGAAVGTLAAEIIVTVYQIRAIRKQPVHLFKDISWLKIIIAALLGTASCVWMKFAFHGAALTSSKSFVILAVSACLFFGVYVISLLVMKEGLVWELLNQTVLSKIKKKFK